MITIRRIFAYTVCLLTGAHRGIKKQYRGLPFTVECGECGCVIYSPPREGTENGR